MPSQSSLSSQSPADPRGPGNNLHAGACIIPSASQDMRATSCIWMLLFRLAASAISAAQWMSSTLLRRQPKPGPSKSTRSKSARSPHCSMKQNARSGVRFLLNHPYKGLYSHVNLIDRRSGLSLLFICNSVYDTNRLVRAALSGDRLPYLPTAILDPGQVPENIPKSWDL